MAAAADWSLLPSDLVHRIADCFLATNDIDYYMDLRAVCSNWRSATDDPKRNPDHPRFRPRQWIVLDDYVYRSDETRLLVNTSTGRFLRKELPLLGNYHVIATTLGGFFVLADGYYTLHAAHILNPFTGHMIHFKAVMPSDVVDAAAVVGSSPTLVLLCDSKHKQYVADPDSKCFVESEDEQAYPLIRLAVVGGMYADGEQRPVPPLPAAATDKIFDLMRQFSIDPSQMFTDDIIDHFAVDDAPEIGSRCFLVQSEGEMFIIIKLRQQQQGMKVFKMDTGRAVLEPVKGIGSRVIFIGFRRCLTVVNADKLPSVEANCIYHIRGMNPTSDVYLYDVYKYALRDEEEEMISDAICWSDYIPTIRVDADPPFTAVQLLSSYTINVRESELAIAQMHQVDIDQLVDDFFSSIN